MLNLFYLMCTLDNTGTQIFLCILTMRMEFEFLLSIYWLPGTSFVRFLIITWRSIFLSSSIISYKLAFIWPYVRLIWSRIGGLN
jgi:hypothetical protein